MAKKTRGRASKVDLLPEDIRAQLSMMLRDKQHSQEHIRAFINGLIEEAGLSQEYQISRSGLNRYASRMETIGKRIRESREMARIWTEKLGQEPEGDVGKLLAEFVKQLAFDTTMHLNESGEPVPAKALSELALVTQRIEQAQMANIKRIQEIRRLALEEAARAVETAGKEAGVSMSDVAQMVKAVYGIN